MDNTCSGANDWLALGKVLEELAEGLIESFVLKGVHRLFRETDDTSAEFSVGNNDIREKSHRMRLRNSKASLSVPR